MKKFWSLLLSVAMGVASLAACGGSSSGGSTSGDAANTGDSANTEAVHFKLSHPSAEGGPYDLMSKKFAELVEEKSGGKYVIDIFAANALAPRKRFWTPFLWALWTWLLRPMTFWPSTLPSGAMWACPSCSMTWTTWMRT